MKKADKAVYAIYLHPFKGGKKEYDLRVRRTASFAILSLKAH